MIEYLACGNIMSDIVEQEDGTCSELHIGGPAMYGLLESGFGQIAANW